MVEAGAHAAGGGAGAAPSAGVNGGDGDVAGGGAPILVHPEVTRRKVDAEIEAFHAVAEINRQRGVILLRHEGHEVDLGLVARVPLPIVVAAVRINFANFDLWPPSVRFIDPLTGAPAPPLVNAWDIRGPAPRPIIPGPHPSTGEPFLCVPGVREYHEHSEHSGDLFLLHRGRAGTLEQLVTVLHRSIISPTIALSVQAQTTVTATGESMSGVGIHLVQGRVERTPEGVSLTQFAVATLRPHAGPGPS